MIPYSFGTSIAGIVSGLLMARIGYRPIIWASWAFMLIGYGLLTMLSDTSNKFVDSVSKAASLFV
jgi:MFS family permease